MKSLMKRLSKKWKKNKFEILNSKVPYIRGEEVYVGKEDDIGKVKRSTIPSKFTTVIVEIKGVEGIYRWDEIRPIKRL